MVSTVHQLFNPCSVVIASKILFSYGNTVVENQPVASVNLVENQALERDPLFDQILRRQTNRRNYDETPLSADQLSGLRDSFTDAGLTLTVTDDAAQRNRVAQIMIDAMRIETAGKARDAESIAMFRFNADERARYRDGFGVAQVGITGIGRWVAETFFLSREDVENDSTSFGEQAVDLTSEQARSASALGWIVTASNQRLDQLATGRAYERLNLNRHGPWHGHAPLEPNPTGISGYGRTAGTVPRLPGRRRGPHDANALPLWDGGTGGT